MFHGFHPSFILPAEHPGIKESLGARAALDYRGIHWIIDPLAFKRQQICLPGSVQAPEIPNTLADSQSAIDVEFFGQTPGYILVVLGNRSPGPFFEFLQIGFSPLVSNLVIAVKFDPLIIEIIPDFMPDNRPNRTVVHRIAGLGIEKWQL